MYMLKHIFICLAVLCAVSFGFAQTGINYKAIIKDTNGNIVANTSVTVQFNIYQGSILPNDVYEETHMVSTDANGLVVLIIGNGTSSDTFADVNWEAGRHFLNVQIDIGDGLIDLGTTEFLSVPFAKHAETAGNTFSGDYTDLTNTPKITTPTGLEAIDEGNGIGWRITGSNPDNYGAIGLRAIDLSYSFSTSSVFGAVGERANAFGTRTIASGFASMACGDRTEASGDRAFASGISTVASGQSSFAGGLSCIASKIGAVALGNFTVASGPVATAMGDGTEASGAYSTAFGISTKASGERTTALGSLSIASGNSSIAMGSSALASGDFSISAGNESEASGLTSVAVGSSSLAAGANSIALGNGVRALAENSMALGNETLAEGTSSFAFGSNCTASGLRSAAIGFGAIASGNFATAMGRLTTAPSFSETVIGSYNTFYLPNSDIGWSLNDRLFVVGNGFPSSSRSDALIILKNGTITAPSFDISEITDNKALLTREFLLFGNNNIRLGNGALKENTIGFNNVGIGLNALQANTNADFNTAIGDGTLYSNTTGNRNTAIGALALFNLTTGSNNIGIGNQANVPNAEGSNQIRIGNSAITYAGVQVGWTITSDKRWKDKIRHLPYGLDMVKQLKPVDYIRKNNEKQTREMGFIAQDLEKTLQKLGYDDQGFLTKDDDGFLSVRYTDFIALLTKAIQEQQSIIETQNNKIDTLTVALQEVNSIKNRLQYLETALKTEKGI
ncbi:hypothetical protein MHTCC0001_31420 [Flavobacteriaceae bacterium MHTCC 0001]